MPGQCVLGQQPLCTRTLLDFLEGLAECRCQDCLVTAFVQPCSQACLGSLVGASLSYPVQEQQVVV